MSWHSLASLKPTRTSGRTEFARDAQGPRFPVWVALRRGVDVVFALILLLLSAPLLVLVAMAVLVEAGRPIIFKQQRGGIRGSPFTIYKFRTMRVMEDGPRVIQAKCDDPRFTRVGAVLRRTSLDELPQLWNVLRGDMSIVGPRPHALAHDVYYAELIAAYRGRQRVKPGITGWAQVQGLRGETSTLQAMSRRVAADLWYIDNRSFSLDFRIMVKTAFVALFQTPGR